MSSQTRQLLATLCVALSLALFARGGADLTDGFCCQTLSYSECTTIMGHILDTITVSHAVVGTSCEVWERHVILGLLRLFVSATLPPWL
jgi:hypothetical protein